MQYKFTGKLAFQTQSGELVIIGGCAVTERGELFLFPYSSVDPSDEIPEHPLANFAYKGVYAAPFDPEKNAASHEETVAVARFLPSAPEAAVEEEHSGLAVNYYLCPVAVPIRGGAGYTAECQDIIEGLGMSFSEGEVFKSIWRSCAERTLGSKKRGGDAVRDAEKMVYYSGRVLVVRQQSEKERESHG